jgi:hypothetical protein
MIVPSAGVNTPHAIWEDSGQAVAMSFETIN